jgi:hypothetical protein
MYSNSALYVERMQIMFAIAFLMPCKWDALITFEICIEQVLILRMG